MYTAYKKNVKENNEKIVKITNNIFLNILIRNKTKEYNFQNQARAKQILMQDFTKLNAKKNCRSRQHSQGKEKSLKTREKAKKKKKT